MILEDYPNDLEWSKAAEQPPPAGASTDCKYYTFEPLHFFCVIDDDGTDPVFSDVLPLPPLVPGLPAPAPPSVTRVKAKGGDKLKAKPVGHADPYDEVTILEVDIEADLKDQPPMGKTYASGINTSSIVLKLNGTQVTPTVTDITNGKHVYYKPSCSELNIPGANTVELKIRDNANAGVAPGGSINDAGNATDPDPVSWSFTLP
jgi:hypothetical protein